MNRIRKTEVRHGSKKNSDNCVNPVKTQALVSALLDWFSKNARDLPWRNTFDPYAIWVSEIILHDTV